MDCGLWRSGVHQAGGHWRVVATHTQLAVGKHQRLAQTTGLLLVVRVKIESEAQALETLVIAGGQLVEEGPDHVSVGLTNDLQLSPHSAKPCLGKLSLRLGSKASKPYNFLLLHCVPFALYITIQCILSVEFFYVKINEI